MKTLPYWVLGLFPAIAWATPEVHYEQCKQNFSYLGTQYQGTTNKNNSSTQWCYLKQPIDGQTWANVRTDTIPDFTTVTGKHCQAPSSYRGEDFYGCSTLNHSGPWCYVDDQNWEECTSGVAHAMAGKRPSTQ